MKTPLNHGWKFAPGRDPSFLGVPSAYKTVEIPHCPTLLPSAYFDETSYQGDFSYRLDFDRPLDSPVAFLVFEGAMLQFDLYLNGESLGHFVSGFLPVKVDVSGKLKEKGNALVVYLDSREDPKIPPFGKVVDYLTFAGIYRPVYLESLPKHYIEDYFIRTDADGHIEVEVEGHGDEVPCCRLYEGEKEILSFQREGKVESPHLYRPEDPYLYRLEIQFGEDVRSNSVAFSKREFREDGFFLNGKKTKLFGLNRHQSFPYFGMAAPASLQKEDARILKDAGINVVRTSHYPQSEAFLDECDKLGLFVLDEIPGWQFISDDPSWRSTCIDFARRMIKKERNHPCLLAYGLRIDESADDDDLYTQIQAVKKELDPDRPSLGVRNFKTSHCLEDIYGYNDFSCEGLGHGLDKPDYAKGFPKLISEHNGHMYPTKVYDDSLQLTEQALRHARVSDDAFKEDKFVGVLGWCAFDYNTHREFGNGDRICHHGVFDLFRNPKDAAYFYASQGKKDSFFVSGSFLSGDYPAALLPEAIVFTNADYVELRKNGKRIGDFYPDYKHFKGLPHPPIRIDDFIGETFDEPRFGEKDAAKMVKALNYAAIHGSAHMKLGHKLFMLKCILKYRLTYTDIYNAYGKYINGWGNKDTKWTLIAKRNGEVVGTVEKGASDRFSYEVKASRTALVHGDEYDCIRIPIRKIDQYGNLCRFAFDAVKVETEGPIEVYGPSQFSLEGGQSAVFIRSMAPNGKKDAHVHLVFDEERIDIPLTVDE